MKFVSCTKLPRELRVVTPQEPNCGCWLLAIRCPECPTRPDGPPCKPCLERRLHRLRLEASMAQALIELRPKVRAEFGAQMQKVGALFLKLSDDIERLAILREWREFGWQQ